MTSNGSRFIRVPLVLAAIALSWPALAAYFFTGFDYPGATDTQVFGVNERGHVIGIGVTDDVATAFRYDFKKGLITVVKPVAGFSQTSVLGINDAGEMVGSLTSLDGEIETAFIRGKDGASTIIEVPGAGWSQARGVNAEGLVSGYAYSTDFSVSGGFIYDPKRKTVDIFLVSPVFTIAQGINARGQSVGSIYLFEGEAYPGSPEGNYSWLRAPDGTVTLFRVNGLDTRARGINGSGLITGTVRDPASGHTKGFTTTLAGLTGYESVVVAEVDLFEVPGQIQTIPEGVTDGGVIVGITFDDSGHQHGFIATPLPAGK
jgi:uncharacterized membrane protein